MQDINFKHRFCSSRRGRYFVAALFSLAILAPLAKDAAAAAVSNISAEDVIKHLNATIAWYQHVNAVDESTSAPQTLLLQDNVRQSAKQVVRTAFTFARTQAALLRGVRTEGPGSSSRAGQSNNLEQVMAQANDRLARLQNQIDELNSQIDKTHGRKQATLVSQRDTLTADLNMAKQVQSALKNMMSFASSPEASSGLLGEINVLAKSDSVPVALTDTPQAQQSVNTRSAAPAAAFHPETAGIMPLLTNSVTLFHARSQIDSLIDDTDKLNTEVTTLSNPIRLNIRGLISQSDALASAANDQTDPAQLAAARQQINAMAAKFKLLSNQILPIGEQTLLLGTTRGALEQWRNATNQQFQSVLEYLAFRLGSLALGIVILLIISNIIRRATFRYVHDPRRRRQFVVMRRFVVGAAITLVAFLTFFSGFGSFATIAGFVTAGLAVALQNVILSVVAYFFLIGRYGLRVGDRVTVSGLSGQVLEVGLVRMYLMELAGSGVDVHSTGRVAVFSNSVIFQPSALIKQAPGTEYTWHTVATILAPDTELDSARKRLEAAVDSVFDKYRKIIEQQHASFERTANIQLADPVPVSRARFTDSGVEVVVRYPVEIQAMSEVDEQVLQAVMRESDKEPKLKLTSGGLPKVLPASA